MAASPRTPRDDLQPDRRSNCRVRALVPTGFGVNCEAESTHALQLAGAAVEQRHLNDLAEDPRPLAEAQILLLAGGFSFGDHLGAGRVLANRWQRRLGEALTRFIEADKLVLGICNGFQTMVRLGLLPSSSLGQPVVALGPNRQGSFYDGWVTLAVDPDSPCVFTRGLRTLEVPVRHGEGRLMTSDEQLTAIQEHHLAPVRYADPKTLAPTDKFPANPNGSLGALAGLCDSSGRLFGLMPHPEAFLYPENHPRWRRQRGPQAAEGRGLQIFRNAVSYFA